ncbi:hypothetical protein ACSLFT_28490 [Streptomyces sp. G6]|uniref:hypothetical protein n=1 Tax=Streptomyces sp. G6 TaxID=1178736 RepID=UPI003ED88E63
MSHPPPPGNGWPPPPPPPARPRWGRLAAWTAGAAIAAFAIGGGLATLTDDDGEQIANPTACKEALSEGAREAMDAGDDATPATALPAPCVGLGEETLQRLTGEAIAEYLDSPEADRVFEDAWREALESAFPSAGP